MFLVVSTSAIDCLERLVSEMTCYVSSGTFDRTQLTAVFVVDVKLLILLWLFAATSDKASTVRYLSACMCVCLSVCLSVCM